MILSALFRNHCSRNSVKEKEIKKRMLKDKNGLQRRKNRLYTNSTEEHRIEGTKVYDEMLRMDCNTFNFILTAFYGKFRSL